MSRPLIFRRSGLQQQIGNQSHPYLYFDGICTFTIEVFQRKVLLHLLEQQLDFPALAVYGDDFVKIRFHVVGQQGYEFALLYVTIGDYTGSMIYCFSAFLPAGFRMSPHALEQQNGKKGDICSEKSR